MLPALLLVLLSAVTASAGRQHEDGCWPTCPQLLSRLPEVRLWCTASSHLPIPDRVLACGPPSGFSEAPPAALPPQEGDGGGAALVATTRGYGALWGRDTRWTVCHADRISYRILSEAYFGAVWDAAADPCPQQYDVWLATYNAPPCWHNNASDHLKERTIDQETATSLPQNRTYQCNYCSFSDYTVTDFSGESYTFVIINVETPMVFLYLSCNETGGAPYPTLKLMDSIYFHCDGCRRWIDFALENLFEYGDCKTGTEELSTQAAVESEDGFIRICKRDWNNSTVLPSTEETTTSLLNTQEANDEVNNTIPDRVQKALRELETKNFDSNALTNRNRIQGADEMLRNLDIIINFSKNLKQRQVSESLEGFELFAETVLQTVNTSEQRQVVEKHEHSTLVVAAGIVGAMVSSDGQKVDLLRHGQAEYLEKEILAQSTSVGVLLPVERDAAAVAIALTVLRHQLLNTSFLHDGLLVNSDVISVQVEISNSLPPMNYVDIFLKPRVRGVRRRCGIWNLTNNAWDFNYCTLYRRGEVVDVCRCRHLTHFAQLVTDADLQWGEAHARPLELLSLAGVCASLLGAAGLAGAAALDRSWRRKPGTRVLLQLGAAVAARDVLFVLVSVDAFRPSWLWPPEEQHACHLVGVALHYALLAAAAWTTAAAVLQLLRLSTLAGAQAVVPHVVLLSSACSWLAPLVPVVTLVVTSGLEAGYPLRQDSATDFLCYPQGVALYAAVVLPVALCTAVNAAIFLYLLLAVLFPVHLGGNLVDIRRHGSVRLGRRALTAAVLFFLLGLPWLLGPPARLPLLAYLFCLLATPQGMALFVFFVLCNGRLRKSICASVSRVTFAPSSSSAAADYSRSHNATANTRINDSVSDAAPLQTQHYLRTREELELIHRDARRIPAHARGVRDDSQGIRTYPEKTFVETNAPLL